MFLQEIQEWIGIVHDTPISISSLHQNLRDAGLTYKLLRKAAAERDEALRQQWMDHARNHWLASQIIVVDESSKDDRTIY